MPNQHPITPPPLSRRMACWLYEGMLMFGVVFIAAYLFGTLAQQHHGQDRRSLLQAFLFVVFGIYFTWFWSKGQTLAMKTWHIRLQDVHGRPVSQKRAFARYVLSWVWLLPPLALMGLFNAPVLAMVSLAIWILVWALASRLHPERQFWHDQWAGTRLIDARPSPAA